MTFVSHFDELFFTGLDSSCVLTGHVSSCVSIDYKTTLFEFAIINFLTI